MKNNKIYTPETPITTARRARKANNIPKKFQYHDPTKFAWLRNPKIIRGIAGTVVLVSLCFVITLVAVTIPTKTSINKGETSLISTSIGKQDKTNTSTTTSNSTYSSIYTRKQKCNHTTFYFDSSSAKRHFIKKSHCYDPP